MFNSIKRILIMLANGLPCLCQISLAQQATAGVSWIRPENIKSPPVWGIHGGIVVGLWPASLEGNIPSSEGGPRGLLRIGYELNGVVYLINYIAVEPLVD